MIHRNVSTLVIALALGCAASASHAQSIIIDNQGTSSPTAKAPVVEKTTALKSQAPVVASSGLPISGASSLRGSRRNVTVIIGDNSCPIYVPPCNYPSYPAYPTYPAYPNTGYGYSGSTYGSSVTISTPGFQNNNYILYPWSTTITTWGSNSGYGNCAPQYPAYNLYPTYPAYPTYVPGPSINGYRGAAGYGVYNYNGGSVIGGGYVGNSYIGNNSIAPPFAVSVRSR